MQFVLLDLLPQLLGQQGARGSGTTTINIGSGGIHTTGTTGSGSSAAAAAGVGHVYNGGLPPMAWIQREQRGAATSGVNAEGAGHTAQEIRQRGNRAMGENNLDLALELYTQAIELEENARNSAAATATDANEVSTSAGSAPSHPRTASNTNNTSNNNNNQYTLELSYCNRALVYIKQLRYSAAAADAREAIRCNPRFFKGYFRLAVALEGLGEYDEAVEEYRRAKELAPTEREQEEISVALAKCEVRRLRQPTTSSISQQHQQQQVSTPVHVLGSHFGSSVDLARVDSNMQMAGSTANTHNSNSQIVSCSSHQPFPKSLTFSSSITDLLEQLENSTSMPPVLTSGNALSSTAAAAVAALPSLLRSLDVDMQQLVTYHFPSMEGSVTSNGSGTVPATGAGPNTRTISAGSSTPIKDNNSNKTTTDAETEMPSATTNSSRWEQAAGAWERITNAAAAIENARAKLVLDYKPAASPHSYSVVNYRPLIDNVLRTLNVRDFSTAARKLVSMCDPEVIAAAEEQANRTQEHLRIVSNPENRGSRQAFHQAVKARDTAYSDLWRIIERASSAIDALHIMVLAVSAMKQQQQQQQHQQAGQGPQVAGAILPPPGPSNAATPIKTSNINGSGEFRSLTDVIPTFMPVSPGRGVPADDVEAEPLPPHLLSREEVTSALQQHQENKTRIHNRMMALMRRTDSAAAAFLEALEAERRAVTEDIMPLQRRCEEIERVLRAHLKAKKEERETEMVAGSVNNNSSRKKPLHAIGMTRQQMEAIESLLPRLKRLRSDVITFQSNNKRGQELLEEEARLEHERLRQERQRIQIHADIEWLRVKEDEDAHRMGRLRDALSCAQQRIRSILDKQHVVHQQLSELIRTDHPELSWNASAGGSKALKWIKGSGLWVNKTFSDFTVIRTLSSTVNSKVYQARARRGEEIALKEVAIEGDESRRTFMNEVNVMVASSSHPNIIEFRGVFFDGPFAYIMMPYYPMGSFRTLFERLSKNRAAAIANQNSNNNNNNSNSTNDAPNSSTSSNNNSNATDRSTMATLEAMRRVFALANNNTQRNNNTNISSAAERTSRASSLPRSTATNSTTGGSVATTAASTSRHSNDIHNNNNNTEGDTDSEQAGLPWFKIQEIFRQVVSGVAYLHERGVVHADLKPSNILIADDFTPVIADFGVAKDIGKLGERDVTQTGQVAGTFDFMPPEVQQCVGKGKVRLTTKCDIWSLGMTLFAVATANAALNGEVEAPQPLPALMPDAPHVAVTEKAVGGNERLANLISTTLQVDPSKRPSAHELLAHPYFTVSLVQDLVSNKQLIQSNNKMEAFRSFLHALRQGMRNPLLISVVRSQMVESVSSIFAESSEGDLLSPLFVVFRGEDGVDEGALTTEMFHLYFQQLVTKHKMLVHAHSASDSDSEAHAAAAEVILTGTEYIPSSDPRIPIVRFNVLGKVLLKCLVENRNVPFLLSPAVFKFLLGVPVSMNDLDGYDRTMATNLKRLLMLSAEDLHEASLDFSEFSSKFLAAKQGEKSNSSNNDGNNNNNTSTNSVTSNSRDVSSHVPRSISPEVMMANINDNSAPENNKAADITDCDTSPTGHRAHFSTSTANNTGIITRDTVVTIHNVRDYVQWRVEYELIGKREEQLKALRDGFQISDTLRPHLQLLSVTELMMQLCGQQHIPPSAILAALQFVEFPPNSNTPEHLKEMIEGFSQNNIRRFLRLCTPHIVVPATGLPPIKIQATRDLTRLPAGHACVSQLDLPDYNDKEVLREKMGIALAHVNDGFYIA